MKKKCSYLNYLTIEFSLPQNYIGKVYDEYFKNLIQSYKRQFHKTCVLQLAGIFHTRYNISRNLYEKIVGQRSLEFFSFTESKKLI